MKDNRGYNFHLMKISIPFLASLFFLIGCASDQFGGFSGGGQVALETDTRPTQAFTDRKMTSLSVMTFDAKSVQTYRGSPVDYLELGRNFTDDLIRQFYSEGKIKISLGEYAETVQISDTVEKRLGDLNLKRNEVSSVITYKVTPFRKVDCAISGRITRWQPESTPEKSFIEIYFKVTDTYDGTVYWITRMRGNYNNVLKTLTDTITTGLYTETKIGAPDSTNK